VIPGTTESSAEGTDGHRLTGRRPGDRRIRVARPLSPYFRYAGPGTVTAAQDRIPPGVKKERGARLRDLSRELSARRWQAKLGLTEQVLVDRPGRGYGDDYSPWLVDAPVGALVRARATGVSEEGIRAEAA